MNFFYGLDDDGDWVQLDPCQHPRTPYVAQAMMQQLGGHVDLVHMVVREWNIAEIVMWKQNQTKRVLRAILSHLTEVQFDYTMALLFRNFGEDIWTVARVYSVTMAPGIINVLSNGERDLIRECALQHFLHGAGVDDFGTTMLGVRMLAHYDTVHRYPSYVFVSSRDYSEWLP